MIRDYPNKVKKSFEYIVKCLRDGKTEFDYNRTKRWAHRYTCDTIWEQGGAALGVSDDDTSVSFKQRTEAYLLSIGVSQVDIDDFRQIMLQ